MLSSTALSRTVLGLVAVSAALLLTTLACTLQIGDGETPSTIQAMSTVERPVVTIISPANGATFTKGQTISVQARAQSASGVTLIELLVNNVRVASQPPSEAISPTTLEAVLDYPANQAGTLTLTVRAYSNAIVGRPAQITVTVTTLDAGTGGTSGTVVATAVPYNPQCRARANTSLNFRSGPGTNYDKLGTLSAGQEVSILGYADRTDGRWWQAAWGSQRGWILSTYTQTLGDCSAIGPAVVPVTPTTLPTVTAAPTLANATSTPTLADLRFSALTGLTEVQLSASGTTQASYRISVRNNGGRATSSFRVALLKPNGTVDYVTVNSLNPGQEYTVQDGNFTVTFTTAGLARLLVTADDQNAIAESDESNNQAYIDINVLGAPATGVPATDVPVPTTAPLPTADTSGSGVSIPVDSLATLNTSNTSTLHNLASLPGHTSEIGGVAFGPGGQMVTAGADAIIQVWDVAQGTVAQTLTGHTDRVTDIAASPSGDTFASASWDGTVRVWGISTGALLNTLDFGAQVEHVAYSANGSRIAAGGLNPGGAGGLQGLVRVWETSSGSSLMSLEIFGPVSGIGFVDNATIAVASQDQDCSLGAGALELYKVNNGELALTLSGHSGSLDALAISTDGSRLAAGGQVSLCSGNAAIWLWDSGGNLQNTLTFTAETRITDLAFNPSAALLASASMDSIVRVWDTASGAELTDQTGSDWSATSVAFRPGGALLVSGGANGTVDFWGAN